MLRGTERPRPANLTSQERAVIASIQRRLRRLTRSLEGRDGGDVAKLRDGVRAAFEALALAAP